MTRLTIAGLALLGLFGVAAVGGAAAQDGQTKVVPPPPGFAGSLVARSVWRNDRGSELTVTSIDASGAFKGEYLNKAPGFGCRNTPFDVAGHVRGDEVRFVVLWKNASESCNSMTAWTGKIDGVTIKTEWELARVDEKTGGLGILKGGSVFTRQP